MYYRPPEVELRHKPNFIDFTILIILFALFALLAWGGSQMNTPYQLGQEVPITLDKSALPFYAARTVLRMFIALFFSFLVTCLVAPLAAKNSKAEKILIPLIDILQSIPILGMLSITITGFIQLFPNSLLGPECAAIFAVFTSQVWNMILSFYQSLKMMPKDLYETASIFHLSAWRQFWRIELPKATPNLLWNAMISLSGGWFFVVAAEAISVSNQQILLPGIGSYISVAILQADLNAIFYAIFTMFIVILLYDQLIFRPLLAWAEKFKPDFSSEDEYYHSWFYQWIKKTRWLKFQFPFPYQIYSPFLYSKKENGRWKWKWSDNQHLLKNIVNFGFNEVTFNIIIFLSLLAATIILFLFISKSISSQEMLQVFYLGGITAIKVAILVVIASLIWVPIGVWIGLRPKMSLIFQPITQFIAAFPVNLIYPIAVTLIVTYQLNVNIWSAPLMILGTQWYILFNVIAATNAIPNDLKLVVNNFSLSHWLKWKRLILPALFPYIITGSMSAAAGAWNASIVSEVLSWGDNHLVAIGLGSYIAEYTRSGDFPRIALGIFVMCCYVLLINRLIWQNLYKLAATKYSLN